MAFFYRVDSDKTTVLSPVIGGAAHIEPIGTNVEVDYTADIWTSASIDIRTAATKAVTEQRDQITISLDKELTDLNLGISYYFSGERDYASHSGSVWSSQRFADGNFTLEERVNVGRDIVGRAGDPNFNRPVLTAGGRVAATQNLDALTVLQLAYELSHMQGYLSSPYRFVGIGGDGLCGGSAALCVPEAHPERRTRHAIAAQARRSMSEDSSIGLGYRFYIDNWGILSHTVQLQAAWLPTAFTTVTLRYRFYAQGASDFYQSIYQNELVGRYVTRDKELSPVFSNRVALAYETGWDVGESDTKIWLSLAVGGTAFSYRDFLGLDQIYAGDATLALSLEL